MIPIWPMRRGIACVHDGILRFWQCSSLDSRGIAFHKLQNFGSVAMLVSPGVVMANAP